MGAVLLEKDPKPIRRKVITGATVLILYTNWQGVTEQRYITPITGTNRWHEGDKFHPRPQWVFDAWCHDRNAIRTFCYASVHKWEPYAS